MCCFFTRVASLAAVLWAASAEASSPTFAVPHAETIPNQLELSAGIAPFPQGSIGLIRLQASTALPQQINLTLTGHEFISGIQSNERFLMLGLSRPFGLGKKGKIAPFLQSVFFAGLTPLDRRLALRAGLAFAGGGPGLRWDTSLPLAGLVARPGHPREQGFEAMGLLDVLLSTELGMTLGARGPRSLRLGLAGTLARLTFRQKIANGHAVVNLASMGSHSLLLAGWIVKLP